MFNSFQARVNNTLSIQTNILAPFTLRALILLACQTPINELRTRQAYGSLVYHGQLQSLCTLSLTLVIEDHVAHTSGAFFREELVARATGLVIHLTWQETLAILELGAFSAFSTFVTFERTLFTVREPLITRSTDVICIFKEPILSTLQTVSIIIIFSTVGNSQLEVADTLWHRVVLIQITVIQGIVLVTVVTGLIGLIIHRDE